MPTVGPYDPHRQAARRQAATTIATSLTVMSATQPKYLDDLRRIASRLLLTDYMAHALSTPAAMLQAVRGQPMGEQMHEGQLRAEAANMIMHLAHRVDLQHIEAFCSMCDAFHVLWRKGGSTLLPLLDEAGRAAAARQVES